MLTYSIDASKVIKHKCNKIISILSPLIPQFRVGKDNNGVALVKI